MILAIDLNPIDDVIDGVGGLVGGAAEAAGEAVLDVVVSFTFDLIADAVAAVTDSIASAMDSTTTVDLAGGFFPALTPIRQTVLGMSMALLLAFFLASIIRSLAAGEPGAIIRAAFVDVPAAIMMMLVSVSVAWILVRIIDEASLAVTGDVGAAMGEFSASLIAVEALTGAGLLGIIFGLLFVIGAILVWLQLLVRSALIYILVLMAPLGFATRAHPATRQIARRTIEMGVALILSKFAVAVAFGVGATAIESSNGVADGDGVDLTGMMAGVAVMLMAAFMPWVIWKAIPLVEAATAASGVERSPMRSAVAGASMAVAASVGISKLAGAGAAGGGGQASGGAGLAGSVPGSSGGPGGGASPGLRGGVVGRSTPVGDSSSGGGKRVGTTTASGDGRPEGGVAVATEQRESRTAVVSNGPESAGAAPLGGPRSEGR